MTHKLTRLLALMLAVVMSFSMLLIPAQAASFTDVSDSAWYAAAVEYVNERGWMAGVSESSFAPNKEVTRGMMVTVLARLEGMGLDNINTVFADVEPCRWYTGAATWAARQGIVAGVGNGKFAPNRAITRQDLCVMLYKYFQARGIELEDTVDRTFSDMDSVAEYAREAVIYCTGVGLISGFSDSTFGPKQTATRAQLAQILMRLDLLRQPKPDEPQPEGPKPAQSFSGAAGEDMSIAVEAPEGALPEDTDLTLTRVHDNAVLATISAAVDMEVLAAADISFVKNGVELEPEKEVEVQIILDGLENLNNPVVVHIKDDGTVENVDSEMISVNRGGQKALRFMAKDFSVYAVVDDNNYGGEGARATVTFHRTDGTTVVFYVKNSDTVEEIEKFIFDPGSGPVPDKKLFAGWTTSETYDETSPCMTIQQVRTFLEGESITEGAVYDFYPMLLNVWTITYYGENESVALGCDAILVGDGEGKTGEYTVNQPFGTDGEHHFQGWHIKEGISNIKSAVIGTETVTDFDADTLLPNLTKLTITGDIKLSAYAPAGHWLVFNENGKGATYNAPHFLETDETTEKPCEDSEMIRNGYDFGGWYTDAACTVGNEFTFGQTITEKTNIYAKWTPKTNSTYTVVLWKQRVNGNGYDYWDSIPKTGTTGQTIDIVTQDGAEVTDYNGTYKNYKIDGTEYSELGFHAGHYDTEKTIVPEGTTVVNVYYDRNLVTMNFFLYYTTAPILAWPGPGDPDLDDGGTYYCSDPDDGEDSSYVYQVYKNDAGEYVYDYISTETITDVNNLVHSSGVNDTYDNTTYYLTYNNQTYRIWYDNSYGWVAGTTSSPSYYANSFLNAGYSITHYLGSETRPAHSPYYYQAGTGWQKVSTIQGLYQSSLFENGYQWPSTVSGSTYRWYPNYSGSSGSGTPTVFLDAFDTQNVSMTSNFYGASYTGSNTVYFMTQDEGSSTYSQAGSAAIGTGGFYLTDKFTGYHLSGYRLGQYGTLVSVTEDQKKLDTDGTYVYDANMSTDSIDPVSVGNNDLYIYFDRLSYTITYWDGIYVDGNGNLLDEPKVTQGFGKSAEITYGVDISGYGDKTDTVHYKVPSVGDEFVFEGWYADETCSTLYEFDKMPLNGVQVYAKWVQVQYRVYLHPNVDSTDSSLDWGDEGKVDENGNPAPQAMCFRISYGGKVSAPEGLRSDFLMKGWYTDSECNQLFNADVFILNEQTVTTPYDRETEATDTFDKYAVLTDPICKDSTAINDRFWITKKLDLYAAWTAKLNGADGIGVAYDLNGGSGTVKDDLLYQDNSGAIAQNAPTGAPSDDLQFLYWEVQTWNGEAYVSAGKDPAYPGSNFKVLVADSQQVARVNPDGTPVVDANGKQLYTYTVQLKAVYGPKEVEQKTHVIWYGNGGTLDGTADGTDYKVSENVQINDKILIQPNLFTHPDGYVFLGWARLEEDDVVSIATDAQGNETYTFTTQEGLGEDDVWLQFHAADGDHEANYFTVERNTEEPAINGRVVTHIAADEKPTKHIMVAVWSDTQYFYVFHSATRKMEAHPLTGEKVDLQSMVTPGYLYGGYYKEYAGMSKEDTAVFNATFSAVYDTNKQNVMTSVETYTGNSIKTEDGDRFWNKAKAFNVDNGDDPGNLLNPKGSEVYFLKEVPDSFLPNRIMWTIDNNNGKQIIEIYLLTVTDDNNYKDSGFFKDGTFNSRYTLSNTFTVTSKINGEYESVTVTPHDINTNLSRGYIAMKPVTTISGYTIADGSFTIVPAWKTLDGVEVQNTKMIYTIGESKTKMTWKDPYVYINYQNQADYWTIANAVIRGCFAKDGGSEWVVFKQFGQGTVMRAEMPEGYSRMVLTRGPADVGINQWGNYWNRTNDYYLQSGKNYLMSFDAYDDGPSYNSQWIDGNWGTWQ